MELGIGKVNFAGFSCNIFGANIFTFLCVTSDSEQQQQKKKIFFPTSVL